MHPDGTVSFTCMRTIPRDDTVTSVRFPASSRVSGIAAALETPQFRIEGTDALDISDIDDILRYSQHLH